jgi:DNA polymerase-1
VPSGRLAARDPNIMAFPKRSKLGKMVRGLFVARPGRMFGAWDHGQIELRVMADDARDERMIAELLPGAPDMHTDNASRFFGIPVGDIDPKGTVRDASKIITYGIAYGAEAERLHFEALVAGFDQYTVDDFVRFRAEWFRKYAGVAAMVRETEQLCVRQGYIEDRWGRARKLPGVAIRGNRWPMSKIREEAIRQGQNHRVQGGAQGFMVRAMLRWPEVRDVVAAAGYKSDLLLQIHDELMAEFDQGAWDVLDPMMQWAMTADSHMLRCGIITDANQGPTWADL